MKKIALLISVAFIGCNLEDNSEVACNCNEVKDKEIVVHEYPYLYWEYNIYVEDCETGELNWIDLHSSTAYNNISRGDCY
jgi:hypothetical protein